MWVKNMEDIEMEEENIEKIENTNNSNSGGKVVKNIIVVAISNIFTLLSGILVGFILPKIMSKADYGFYKTFTLYTGYIGLLHFGFIDGIYLLFAGIKYNDLNKEKFRTYTRFLLLFQLILSLVIMVISIPFMGNELGLIFFFIGINIVLNSMTTFYQFISQITSRFKELSILNIIKAILNSLSIIILTLLYYSHVINLVSYVTYLIIYTVIAALITIWYVFAYREILFGSASSLKEEKKEIIKFFKVGFPLLVANLVSSFILTIDRQFVSILFDIETYASYAFAYNLLGLITTVIAAISVVLYPTIKVFNDEQLKNNYNRLNAIIAIVVSLCVGAYYPLKFIIENFLPNYVDSLPIFRVILPGLVISSCISMIMFNYYKALNKQTRYFVISVIILAISFLANLVAYLIFKTPLSISIASIIVMAIWYVVVEFTIVKKYKLNPAKNIIYILAILAMFFILTQFIDNPFIGFGIYMAAYIAITLVFYFKLVKSKFKYDK